MNSQIPSIAWMLLCAVAATAGWVRAADSVLSTSTGSIQRIAFGSCAKQDQPQPIWDSIVATAPQLFLFVGDNIYGDTRDMTLLRAKWSRLGALPGYQRLQQLCPILATWDDHDYGENDAGADYPMRQESQQVFLDFFGVPTDSPRRTQPGVYHSTLVGPEDQRVQIVLLDVRYFRSPLKKGLKPSEPGDGYRGIYVPNDDPNATILGETQWQWLEKQLRVPAKLRLIGSGTQILPDEHGWECWGNFPQERQRLLKLIHDTQANGVVFLSGDRHLAELMKSPSGVGLPKYPIYEVTSSSLNTPSGNITKAGVRFANEINRYRVGLTFFDVNFGMIEIDWTQPDPLVRLQVRDGAGAVVLQQRVRLSELKPR